MRSISWLIGGVLAAWSVGMSDVEGGPPASSGNPSATTQVPSQGHSQYSPGQPHQGSGTTFQSQPPARTQLAPSQSYYWTPHQSGAVNAPNAFGTTNSQSQPVGAAVSNPQSHAPRSTYAPSLGNKQGNVVPNPTTSSNAPGGQAWKAGAGQIQRQTQGTATMKNPALSGMNAAKGQGGQMQGIAIGPGKDAPPIPPPEPEPTGTAKGVWPAPDPASKIVTQKGIDVNAKVLGPADTGVVRAAEKGKIIAKVIDQPPAGSGAGAGGTPPATGGDPGTGTGGTTPPAGGGTGTGTGGTTPPAGGGTGTGTGGTTPPAGGGTGTGGTMPPAGGGTGTGTGGTMPPAGGGTGTGTGGTMPPAGGGTGTGTGGMNPPPSQGSGGGGSGVVVVAPPPVVSPPVIQTSPTYTAAYPPTVSNVAPNVLPNVAPPSKPVSIRIVNPASNGVSLNYTLNGQQFTMKPGEEQSLNQGSPIAFDRGGSLGTAQYDLTDGVYQFGTAQDGGWDLFRNNQ